MIGADHNFIHKLTYLLQILFSSVLILYTNLLKYFWYDYGFVKLLQVKFITKAHMQLQLLLLKLLLKKILVPVYLLSFLHTLLVKFILKYKIHIEKRYIKKALIKILMPSKFNRFIYLQVILHNKIQHSYLGLKLLMIFLRLY